MPQVFVKPYIPIQEPSPVLPYYLPPELNYSLPVQYASLTPPDQVFEQEQSNINILPAEQEYWTNLEKAGMKNVYETLAKPVKKLLGVGGEERYQTWPERTIRSALALPAEVYKGEVLSGPGLRREDYTDIPGQTQPLDPMIERAQDVAGLAGGTMFAGVKPGVATLGAGPVKQATKIGNEELSYLLKPKSQVDIIGKEIGKVEPNGISILKLKDSPEGYDANRLVYTKDGKIIGAMQLTKIPNSDVYKVANTYVDPKFRRQGIGTELNEKAKELFGKIESSELEASPAGQAFRESVLRSETSKVGAPLAALEKTSTAYHGTPAAGFEKFNVPNAANEFMIDRALGVHVAKDPSISETFLKDNQGGIYKVKIPDDSKFLELDQPLHPYIKDKNTPKTSSNVATDQYQIEKLVMKTAFQKDPELLARYLVEARRVPESEALSLAKKMSKGGEAKLFDGTYNLDKFVNNFGGRPYNPYDRVKAIELFKKDMKDKGYVGIKYINTSPMETAGAKDFTSYVVFEPSEHIRNALTGKLMSSGLQFPKPLEQPTFDERWRDRVPEEFIQNDEIKNFLDNDKIRPYPTNIQAPGRFNDKRQIRLTKVNYDPFK